MATPNAELTQLLQSDLGLRAEDRASYWDAVRSGLIGG